MTVVDTIEGDTRALLDGMEDWVRAIVGGSDLRRIERQLASRMSTAQWTWPWFDAWNETFTRWGEYPTMWPELMPNEDEIGDWSNEEVEEHRREQVVELVIHVAAALFYREVRMAQAQPHHQFRLVPIDAVENRVAATFMNAIAVRDLTNLPPYFPGDRTTVQNIGPFGVPSP